ncbi:Hypothetical predicted protein [Podarcis lilfordi]|uniref:Uncharacterized protein n=1 Tax=Podarcis lilfordi TaxID=74358 RepID=A0AA35PJH9_9SAUR|nr:Hypothetical predicted protein [Podarcis lilfordi]
MSQVASTPLAKNNDHPESGLTPPEEIELIASFADLPAVEQKEIINRLESLKTQLIRKLSTRIPMYSEYDILEEPVHMDIAISNVKCMSVMEDKIQPQDATTSPSLQPEQPSVLLIDLYDRPLTNTPEESSTQQEKSPSTHSSMPDLEPSYSTDQSRDEVPLPTFSNSPLAQPYSSLRSIMDLTARPATELIEDPTGHINQVAQKTSSRLQGDQTSDEIDGPHRVPHQTLLEKGAAPAQGPTFSRSSGQVQQSDNLVNPPTQLLREVSHQRKITDFLLAPLFPY